MVKLNLLEIPEDQQTGIREQDDLSEFSKATEDIDLSFFQQSNEPAEPTTINTSSPMFGDDDTGDQSDIFSAPVSDFTGDSITHDEPVNFDQDSGSA
ncbi:MAG TPA: hypothetical protein PKV71_08600, partial [Calditrichia bacterium]|nr:hypothetical protein [Calditrichia bacterium]